MMTMTAYSMGTISCADPCVGLDNDGDGAYDDMVGVGGAGELRWIRMTQQHTTSTPMTTTTIGATSTRRPRYRPSGLDGLPR